MKFCPEKLDYTLSPYTGLTRESWIEAGIYILKGMFQHIPHLEDPIVMPRKDTKVSYPHLSDSKEQQDIQRRAAMFEGLTRSFFFAAPLIHEMPELEICGHSVREYYKYHVLQACTKGSKSYVGDYKFLQELANYADPFRPFQQTVETCALVICLSICKDELWNTYTKEEKDLIAGFLSSFGHANTVPQNWRLFNMLDLAFLYQEGYPIDHEIMLEHAQSILHYYAGDGWYRDGHSFDYYSCWAFNVYTGFWCQWYGYEKEPYLAEQFEKNSNRLMETYPNFFDEDGFTNMWGRSNIYRNASTSAFDGNMLFKNPAVNYGLARRISSGSLLQFFTREDFLYKGIPTLGFYGQFTPLVQGYSCAESPYWMGKAFLCLHLPKDHPFWTEKENNGIWESMDEHDIHKSVLNGPALCFTNHKANHSTILRSGKILKSPTDLHGMWNYSKLCYNTKYPWESTPVFPDGSAMIRSGELESMQYVLKDLYNGSCSHANVTFWCGEKDHVLYRRQFFGYDLNKETHWMQGITLADIEVPYGIFRADRLRLFQRPVQLTLGSYGFPDNGTEIIRKQNGLAQAIILKGTDSTGQKKQLAMTIYGGFTTLDLVSSSETNPDSEKSIVLYATGTWKKQYGGYEPYLLLSQTLTREDHTDFTDDELFPLRSIAYTDPHNTGAYGPVTLNWKNNTSTELLFDSIEGTMQL